MFKKITAATIAVLLSSSVAFSANIVQTAKSAGQFNTLLAAAKASGLVPALSGHSKLTVFAPTDDAFSKLPKGTVEMLLKPENKHKLADILKYHVVAGEVKAGDIPLGINKVKTLKKGGDENIRASRFGKFVRVDGAKVVAADIQASNGVIHVINKVLLPSS